MHFDAKDMRRLMSSALCGMPTYEHMSKSTVSTGWKSFATRTDVGSWEGSVRGHLARLDEDWEDYKPEALQYENELAAKERRKLAAKAKRDAACAEIADRSGDSTGR
jgi:hypothetical protein